MPLALTMLARLAQALVTVVSALEGIVWVIKAAVNILLRAE